MTIIEKFDKLIPDDCDRLCFRIDYGDYAGNFDEQFWEEDIILDTISSYVGEYWQLFAKGACLHTNGTDKRSHVHYVFIVKNKITHSNWSKHRSDYMKKSDDNPSFGKKGQVTFKICGLGDTEAKSSIFACILKYGTVIPRTFTYNGYRPMVDKLLNALIESGRELPERLSPTVAASKKRKRCELIDLHDLCKAGFDSNFFKNLQDMRIWLDKEYIEKLKLEDIPNPDIFEFMCIKVATKLGIYKYSEF